MNRRIVAVTVSAMLALALVTIAGARDLAHRHTVLPLLQARLVDADRTAWLDAGTVPATPELGDSTLVADALADLHRLTLGGSVPVAGDAGPWRYVWPRDAAFVAVAFARTGHLPDAVAIIDFLQRVQAADGTFQGRYRSDTGTPPDHRGVQLDGTGWALWATAAVARAMPAPQQTAFLAGHERLIIRSTALLEHLAGRSRLPVSPDYWEVSETRPTLATATVLAAGLDAAATLRELANEPAAALTAARSATRLRSRITADFGPDGYPRRLGGRAGSVDLGVAFGLPPFARATDPGLLRAWRTVPRRLHRPAGGLAPGGSWHRDGISWTNVTATAAMTDAALGDRSAAVDWLRWIDAHRTPAGSIPEKVLWDGRPASVAPLAWSAAAVVITATELRAAAD